MSDYSSCNPVHPSRQTSRRAAPLPENQRTTTFLSTDCRDFHRLRTGLLLPLEHLHHGWLSSWKIRANLRNLRTTTSPSTHKFRASPPSLPLLSFRLGDCRIDPPLRIRLLNESRPLSRRGRVSLFEGIGHIGRRHILRFASR